ncbi:hypothetical protein ACQUY5_20165 [Bacillus cereus]|uniref:hypothetical protein n=1 Tax=Bacillus cereus TaxID=1396 RepID=UPI003D167682
MLTDEKLVELLYNSKNLGVTVQYESISNDVIYAHVYFPDGRRETVDKEIFHLLYKLKMLIEDKKYREYNKTGKRVLYRLSKVTNVQLDIVKDRGVFKLKNYYRFPFLSVSKQACILSHVGGGMVDFTYDDIEHIVKKSTPYSFFIDQYRVAKEEGYRRSH